MGSKKNKSRFFGLFSKKSDADAIRLEMRKELRTLDGDIHGVDYDLRHLGRQRQKLIQRGIQKTKENDQLAVQETGQELRTVNAEIAEVQQYKSNLVKSRLLCKISLRKLESTMPKGAMTAAKRVIELLEDEDVEKEIANKECSEEDFQRMLDRKLSVMMKDIEMRSDTVEMDTSKEVELFAALAQAEEQGDTEKIRTLTAELTGDTKQNRDLDDILS